MAQTWQCPTCKTEGGGLAAVVTVLHRHPSDPARDVARCKTCQTQRTRYEFLKEEKETA